MTKKEIKLRLELAKDILINEYKDDFGRTIYGNEENSKYDPRYYKKEIKIPKYRIKKMSK